MQNDHSPPLYERLFAELQRAPGRKASELADALGVDRHEINRCLNLKLTGRVRQGSDYRWHPVDPASTNQPVVPAAPDSELARLSRYFLECIGQDMDEGVSVFAINRDGDIEYAPLSCLPQVAPVQDWFNQPGAARVLGKVRQDRGKLTAWLGYPVRLRHHRTARWEGFFVEPVLLWRIELGAEGDDYPRIHDGAPVPNAKFLRSVAMGDGMQLAEETARLVEELGLNVPIGDLPDADDLIERLQRIRPDWDWQEPLDPSDCRGAIPIAELSHAGIYNRAVIVPSERSPYTQGLETELKALAELPETRLQGTALGHWLKGGVDVGIAPANDEPLIEVLPMNSEQRAAVRAALSSSHSVITGPPGTGKSQVVTNLLVNAAWRGMKVLFASKNNKAVDVVEGRVNGLGSRPVLLRLGAKEYEAKLASYLTRLLAGNPGAEERAAFDESIEHHKRLTARLEELDRVQQQTLDARNTVDRLDNEAEQTRLLLVGKLASLDEAMLRQAEADLVAFERAIDDADKTRQGWFTRLMWSWVGSGRIRTLEHLVSSIAPRVSALGAVPPDPLDERSVASCRDAAEDIRQRLEAVKQELAYREALEALQRSPSFEQIAVQRADLTEQLAENSQRLWRDWVQLAPSRLSPAQRKAVADYAAVLQVMTAPDAQRVHSSVRQRAKDLQCQVTELFSCWAVTSLSARGRVPFEPGYFDLVVIDEASQCDIASALPLLFRAKRSVVIGDPQQLRHISALTRPRDSELQYKYGIVDTRVGWMYSVASLYDVAAGVVTPESIVNLRDHHRSHADIIEFSNRAFYEGRLRTATRYRTLKRPRNNDPGIVWHDVQGKVLRPNAGGAQNSEEARVLIADLEDLLVRRRFEGTVGVVTPFRAQAQLLQQLVQNSDALTPCREKAELLVDTVHRFQGDERDVMFFSPVVSSGTPIGALGFLRASGNLFNVAITRARGLLHVVGDQQAAIDSGIEYLASFANYVASLSSAAPSAGNRDVGALTADYPRVSKPEVVSEWERILYRALYQAAVRAIPQYSVEQYDLDFAVIVGERRLNIEVDGERYHRSWTGELCLRDQLRNQRLIELGWEVKRFWVYEVRDRLPQCVATVTQWVEEAGRAPAEC